ncbi:MAG: hypothetical protein LUD15_14340 [Bacteroides sp.]|nr:hypothetical protein [Bacteroides sp.]
MLYVWFMAMYTRIDLVLCNGTEEKLKEVADRIKNELADLEQMANYYDTGSKLYKLNQLACKQPVALS